MCRILGSLGIFCSSPASLFIIGLGLSDFSRSRGLDVEDEAREEGGKEVLNSLDMILVGLTGMNRTRTEVGEGPGFYDMGSTGGLLGED